MNFCRMAWAIVCLILVVRAGLAAETPTRDEARAALQKAVQFFSTKVAVHGGYVYRYSGDLALRAGEGWATETQVWVQPPGTPFVGEAFLDACEATGDSLHRDAARAAAQALIEGQLRTGGWYYHIEFDPEKRQGYGYRDCPQRRKQEQKTTLDDDTTQAAVRFLMRMDKTLQFNDAKVHEAAMFALKALLAAQFPNGGWYVWWEKYPEPRSAQEYPVLNASYPESWSRTWTRDSAYSGCYVINDNLMADMIAVMFEAGDVYGGRQYLESAEKAGGFLLKAQMPDPQPAWAQQYDRQMQPVWGRQFEPPAVTALESQGVIEALMLLYRRTGDDKYLAPIPRAIKYLRGSQLANGRLARFYELKTNKPLYFYQTGKAHHLTYSSDNLAEHYSFIVDSRLDALEAECQRLRKLGHAELGPTGPAKAEPLTPALAAQAGKVIAQMDPRGAWVEKGGMKLRSKKEPPSGIIDCRTFADNVRILCRFIQCAK